METSCPNLLLVYEKCRGTDYSSFLPQDVGRLFHLSMFSPSLRALGGGQGHTVTAWAEVGRGGSRSFRRAPWLNASSHPSPTAHRREQESTGRDLAEGAGERGPSYLWANLNPPTRFVLDQNCPHRLGPTSTLSLSMRSRPTCSHRRRLCCWMKLRLWA